MRKNGRAVWRRSATPQEIREVAAIDKRMEELAQERFELSSRRFRITNRAHNRATYRQRTRTSR